MVLDWLLPCPCPGCGASVMEVTPALGLCGDCRRSWPRRAPGRCALCGREIASAVGLDYRCGGCGSRRAPHSALTIGWTYLPPLTHSVRGLKFGRQEGLAEHLVDHLMDRLSSAEVDRLRHSDQITAVPLWWRRRLTRGYNQAELLALAVARRTDLPYRRLLVRQRGGTPQSALARDQRRRNVRGTVRIKRGRRVAGSVLLIDDVLTTGATLEECARVLRCAGAQAVQLLAVARTPETR